MKRLSGLMLMVFVLLSAIADSANAAVAKRILSAGNVTTRQVLGRTHTVEVEAGNKVDKAIQWEWLKGEHLTSELDSSIIASNPDGFIESITSHITKGRIFPYYHAPYDSFTVHLKIPEDTPPGEYTVSTLHHSTFEDSRDVRNDWIDVIKITVTKPDVKVDVLGWAIRQINPDYGLSEGEIAEYGTGMGLTGEVAAEAKGFTADGLLYCSP